MHPWQLYPKCPYPIATIPGGEFSFASGDYCLPCEENSAVIVDDSKKVTKKDSPFCLIDISKLRNFFNCNFDICKVCKNGTLSLIERDHNDFASSLEINCPSCCATDLNLNYKINRLKFKYFQRERKQ